MSVLFKIDVDLTPQNPLRPLPQLSEKQLVSLQEVIMELALLFQERLPYVRNGKYVVRFSTQNDCLDYEAVNAAVIDGTSGVT